MAYLYIKHKITGFFKVDVGISVETGNFLPKNGYGWIWGIFYRKIRIWMDMDPAERGGVEWVSEFCPVKGSSLQSDSSGHLRPHVFSLPAGRGRSVYNSLGQASQAAALLPSPVHLICNGSVCMSAEETANKH